MAPTSHTGRALGVMCFYIGGATFVNFLFETVLSASGQGLVRGGRSGWRDSAHLCAVNHCMILGYFGSPPSIGPCYLQLLISICMGMSKHVKTSKSLSDHTLFGGKNIHLKNHFHTESWGPQRNLLGEILSEIFWEASFF